ncbi:hypothetical protein V8E53_007932 [Lactarius tabidus]
MKRKRVDKPKKSNRHGHREPDLGAGVELENESVNILFVAPAKCISWHRSLSLSQRTSGRYETGGTGPQNRDSNREVVTDNRFVRSVNVNGSCRELHPIPPSATNLDDDHNLATMVLDLYTNNADMGTSYYYEVVGSPFEVMRRICPVDPVRGRAEKPRIVDEEDNAVPIYLHGKSIKQGSDACRDSPRPTIQMRCHRVRSGGPVLANWLLLRFWEAEWDAENVLSVAGSSKRHDSLCLATQHELPEICAQWSGHGFALK